MKRLRVFSILLLVVWSQLAAGEGTIISIEGATIRGNQELPTVLYLVPWQPAEVQSLDKPKQTLASSRPLQRLDRASFLRMQAYHESFRKQNSGEIIEGAEP